MGKILEYLGVDESSQSNDVLIAEQILEGMQKIYSQAEDSPKKDYISIPLSEMVKVFIENVKKTKPIEDEQEVEPPIEEDDFPYKVGDKFSMEFYNDVTNKTSTYIYEIKSILEDIVYVDMRGEVGLIEDITLFKSLVIKNVDSGMWIPIIDEQPITQSPPTTPTPPQKPSKPSKPKPQKPTPPQPPKPQSPCDKYKDDDVTLDELKETLKLFNKLVKKDPELKDEIDELKERINCKQSTI
jgi:hypothetical protein